MRRDTSTIRPNQSGSYGAGTRVGVHRSRSELERVLGRYGASDFAFVGADASASIQFAMDGRYVQVALPLPDPNASQFTHSPSGRPRTPTAQERAYEQALREHWRALLLAVRGKLQSVESGISTFEAEFAAFLVPYFEEERKKKGARRKKPKAVNWLLGGSHSVAIALVAAFLVPASAVGAFALPPSVVGHLAAPFRSALPDQLAVPSEQARALALGQSSWVGDESPSHGDRLSPAAERRFAVSPRGGEDELADSASEAPSGIDLGVFRNGAGSGSAPNGLGPEPSGGQASGGEKQGSQQSGESGGWVEPPELDEEDAPAPGASDDPPTGEPSTGDAGSESAPGDVGEAVGGSETSETATDSAGSGDETPAADPADEAQAGDSGNGHDNGNHNGADNGNKNGADNGSKNDAPTPPASDAGNGNGNGADKDKNADDKPKQGKDDAKAGH